MSIYLSFLLYLFIINLISIFFTKNFFAFFFLLTKSRLWSIRLTAFFLLPGTIIHELSHWFTAELLCVPTGRINLWPKYEDKKEIKMGSVQIGQCDPFRRTLIGLAPLIFGLSFITLSANFLNIPLWENFNSGLNLAIMALIFIIANTMFASQKDLKESFVPFFLIAFCTAFIWFFDLKLPQILIDKTGLLINKINPALLLTIYISLGFLVLTNLMILIWQKLLGRRIVYR